MTPATLPNIELSPALVSAVRSSSPPQEVAANAGGASTTENAHVTGDTVSISSQSRHALTAVKEVESQIEKAKKEETKRITNGGAGDKDIAKIQFVYNPKGDLSIKYMDTASRLIYQIPSELMLRLKESAQKADSSVDTKA